MDRKTTRLPAGMAAPPAESPPRAPRLGPAGEAARIVRQQRLATALRANLHRRKAAARDQDRP